MRPAGDPSGAIGDLELVRIIDDATGAWSSVGPCTDLVVSNGGLASDVTTNLDGGPYDGENRIVIRRSDWPAALGSATLAITTTAYLTRTGELLDADIDVNGVDAQLSIAALPAPSDDDLLNTVTHEMGHALGLAHSPAPSATMFATSGRAEITKRDLDADDRDAICTIYPRDRPTPDAPIERNPSGCACRAGSSSRAPLWARLLVGLAIGAAARRRSR